MTKTCTKCGEAKPATLEHWYADQRKQDGFRSACKQCVRLSGIEWRLQNPDKKREAVRNWQERNRDRHRETSRAWRLRNVEKARDASRKYYERNRDLHRDRGRAWREQHPDKVREISRTWRERNYTKAQEMQREWRQRNPDKVREQAAKRRARKADNGVFAIAAKDQARLTSQPCAHARYGPCSGLLELDHIIPISRGGSHGIGNLQMLCRKHNRSKQDRLEVEVRARYLVERAS